MQNIFAEFNKFSQVSGLNVSRSKTEGLWIGRNRQMGEQIAGITWPETGIKVLGIFFSHDEAEMSRQNFDKRIIEMKSILSKWKKRGLSLIGKTQILKTFIMSKIIYLLSNIVLPQDFIKEVEKLMFKFLWDGPDKIMRASLFTDIKDGGLKFPHIQSMINTQLVKWVNRLFFKSGHCWALLCEYFLRCYGGKMIFTNNYCIDKLHNMDKVPVFYSNLLNAWSKTAIRDEKVSLDGSLTTILKQCVWNNQFITIDKKSIFCKPLQEIGIYYVYQLFDHCSGEIRHFDFWKEKGLQTKYFLTYAAIVKCVRKELKCPLIVYPFVLELLQKNQCRIEEQLEEVESELQKLKTKELYNCLLKEFTKKPVSETLFSSVYNLHEKDWQEIYVLPFKCTVEVKLRVFQFKLLHKILYTNDRLFKMKIVDSELCSLCKENLETPEHLFFYCDISSKLRQEFIDKFGIIFGVKFDDLTIKRIMLGFIQDWKGPHKMLLNHLLLIYKRYIYVQKRKSELLSFCGLKSFISHIKNIEFTIAYQKKIERIHYKKWSPLEKLL